MFRRGKLSPPASTRLVALAKLWAALKYFHPYLAYPDKLDWDEVLVRTIPKVNTSKAATAIVPITA